MYRSLGISFGLFTHALFGVTVWRLFAFLHWSDSLQGGGALWQDLLLALQFSVVHSLLLYPPVRKCLSPVIKPQFYGCFFCMVTSLSLLLLFAKWQPSRDVVWQLGGAARLLMEAGFYASWAALFYSLALSGLGYQTGWTPWWHWLRGRPQPRRHFKPRGVYHFFRHPIYLSFMGLIWFTPVLTLDRAVLLVVWTVYIFLGSYFKDRRLVKFVGRRYLAYQSRVPGYHFMFVGPLAKVRLRRTRPPAPPRSAADTVPTLPKIAA